VVKEYAELLRLDAVLGGDLISIFGGQPGWTLEELIYRSGDPAVGALHEGAAAPFMGHVDGGFHRLEALDFAAYAALEMLRRGRMARGGAAEPLKWVAGQALCTS
jgi:hypothetical protein